MAANMAGSRFAGFPFHITIGLIALLLLAHASFCALAQEGSGSAGNPPGTGNTNKPSAGKTPDWEKHRAPDGRPDLTDVPPADNVIMDGHTSVQRLIDEWDLTSDNCDPNEFTFQDSDVKKALECRLDPTDHKLYIYEIEYFEYACRRPPLLRRIVVSWKKTDKLCSSDDYRLAILEAQRIYEESDEQWPEPPPPPPIPQPPAANCVTPQGHVRPILVATAPGYMGVIWIDEQGNQFGATYNADGTSTWDGGGTPPARPSAEELSKAGSLSSSAFREYQEKLPKKACDTLAPQEPKPPEKAHNLEHPHREVKKPKKRITSHSTKRARRKTEATATHSGLEPGVAIGIGMGILGGNRSHESGRFGRSDYGGKDRR